jgi:hypothetical protein
MEAILSTDDDSIIAYYNYNIFGHIITQKHQNH